MKITIQLTFDPDDLDPSSLFCGRCQKELKKGHDEACWFCTGPLCWECWDKHGHCGHPNAEKINQVFRPKDTQP